MGASETVWLLLTRSTQPNCCDQLSYLSPTSINNSPQGQAIREIAKMIKQHHDDMHGVEDVRILITFFMFYVFLECFCTLSMTPTFLPPFQKLARARAEHHAALMARRKARKKAGAVDEDEELPNFAFFSKRRVELTARWRDHSGPEECEEALDMWTVRV